MNATLKNLEVPVTTKESEGCRGQSNLTLVKQTLTPANQKAKIILLSLLARYEPN